MQPQRIQLSRKKGWRKPANTVVVSWPGKWGNPFRITDNYGLIVRDWRYCDSRLGAVKCFTKMLNDVWPSLRNCYPSQNAIRQELRGKNLACWCPIGQPCHADVLLKIANEL